MSEEFEAVARVADLDGLDAGIPVSAKLSDGTALCLVRDGERIHAVIDRCSHRDFALSGGDIVAPCIIECPWHGARFDVRTGAVLTGPAEESIAAYDTRVVDGMLYVRPTPVEDPR